MSILIDAAERQGLIRSLMERGIDTYAGRESAWHQMGEVVGKFTTWEELYTRAKADFMVFKSQLHDGLGRPVEAWGTFRWDLDDKTAGNKDAAKFLAPVGQGYTVIQHTDGFKLLDSLVGNIDGAHYETMGTVNGGRVVWGQVNPNIAIRVGDDITDVYLTFRTSHDGSTKTEVYETGDRAVCRNTLRIGALNRLAATLSVKHTKNANVRMSDWKAELAEIRTVALTMQEKLTMLAAKRVTRESMDTIMGRLFPMQVDDEGKKVETTRRTNIIADVLKLYESNDKDAFPEQRGTAYNLLNAVTEYTDHYRAADEGRAVSAQFGTGAKLKQSALDLILGEAQRMPEVIRRGSGGVGADVVGEMLLGQ